MTMMAEKAPPPVGTGESVTKEPYDQQSLP